MTAAETDMDSKVVQAMCIGKQMISFAFGIYLLEWVQRSGYATIVAGVFCGVLFANNLLLFLFMGFGKRIRCVDKDSTE